MELLPIREPRFRQVGYIRPFYAPHPPKTITPPRNYYPPPQSRGAYCVPYGSKNIYGRVYQIRRHLSPSRGRKHNYTYLKVHVSELKLVVASPDVHPGHAQHRDEIQHLFEPTLPPPSHPKISFTKSNLLGQAQRQNFPSSHGTNSDRSVIPTRLNIYSTIL